MYISGVKITLRRLILIKIQDGVQLSIYNERNHGECESNSCHMCMTLDRFANEIMAGEFIHGIIRDNWRY